MRMPLLLRIVGVASAIALLASPPWAQQTAPAKTAAPAASSQQTLDQLLAPIALYPDALPRSC